MKNKFIPFVLLCFSAASLQAQTCQKDNVADIINRLPTPFPNAAAVQKAAGKKDVSDFTMQYFSGYSNDMDVLLKKIETPNPVTVRQQQQGTLMEEKFKNDDVQQMTPEQQLAYAKKNNLGGGDANNSISLAEKLKDPVFKKQFAAMSPQEKMALMQQQGVMKPQTTPGSGNPMQGDFQSLMQDPAFRAKWAKMSKSEQDAYIANMQKTKGYDKSKQAAPGNNQNSGSLSDAFEDAPADTRVTTPIADAIAKTKALANALQQMSTLSHNTTENLKTTQQQIDADLKKADEIAVQKQSKEGIAMAKSQGKKGLNWLYSDPKADHEMRLNFLNKSVNESNAALSKLSGEWNQRSAQIKKLTVDYQAAMEKINYGEALYTDDKQFQNLATLAAQQGLIFSSLKEINNSFGNAANAGAKTQQNLQTEIQQKVGKRELVSEGG